MPCIECMRISLMRPMKIWSMETQNQGETLESLSWIWGEQQIKEGKLIPVQNEQIKKALEL